MKHDGGPAFPETRTHYEHGRQVVTPIPGLSKREWFAGMALQGMLANSETERFILTRGWSGGETVDRHSQAAYIYADAMLGEANYRDRLELDREEAIKTLEQIVYTSIGRGSNNRGLAESTLAAIKAREDIKHGE